MNNPRFKYSATTWIVVAVGTAVSRCPPHRPVLAQLTHTVLTLDAIRYRKSAFYTLAWLLKFIEHRIADTRIVRLLQKWLKAGILEQGRWSETEMGTPQGAVISPILANLYLHYVLDLWANQWRQKKATGEVMIVP
jgi:hypothetical protein